MGRMYSIPFEAVAVSAAQDLWEVLAASGKNFTLHEIVVGQSSDAGDTAAEMLGISIKRWIGGTSGSGGGTVTPAKHDTNDAAAGATAEINNTTQAVAGGGSLTTVRSECFNIQGGYQYLPAPEQRITFLAAERCVVSVTLPADALTMSGTMVIEEH